MSGAATQFVAGLTRKVPVRDEHPDGLVDDRHLVGAVYPRVSLHCLR